jgi:hypothetical protein
MVKIIKNYFYKMELDNNTYNKLVTEIRQLVRQTKPLQIIAKCYPVSKNLPSN